ncbi:MAG TPA: hypothetical protein DEO88_12515 [Syntrophobacteraceae bacterium]|nr:hypothetical protein [Syntrophobacteraceae bacterium]
MDNFRSFSTNQSTDVFLDQNYNNPAYRHYELRTSDPNVTIAGGTGYFLGWAISQGAASLDSASNARTCVTFTQANTNIVAQFKGHLRSSIANVTGPTNQRKIAKDINGRYHIAYASAGNLWYTMSSDGGTSWAKEVTWGQGNAPGNPSCATSSKQDCADFYAVWTETAGSGVKHLYFAKRIGDGVMSIQELDASSAILDSPPTIGVSSDGNYFLILYKKVYSGRNQIHYMYSDDGLQSWYGPTALSCGTPIIWDDPSIAWNDSRSLFLASFNSTSEADNLSFNPVSDAWANVSSYYNGSVCTATQTAVDATGREYYAWAVYDPNYETQAAMIRCRQTNNAWSSIYELVPDYSDNPAVMTSVSANSASGGATFFVTDGAGSELFRYTRDGSSWSYGGLEAVSTASYPATVEKSAQNTLGTLVTTGDQPPYNLRFEQKNIFSKVDVSGALIALGHRRRLEFWDTMATSTFQIDLAQPVLSTHSGNTKINFAVDSCGEFLQTESFPMGMQDRLDGDLIVRTKNWKQIADCSVELVDASSGTVLAVLNRTSSISSTDSLLHVRLTKSLLDTPGLVYLRAKARDLSPSTFRIQPIEVDVIGNVDGPRKEGGKAPKAEAELPSTYELSEPYPNPFNPSTSIRYGLPFRSHVTLSVFNILGQQITILHDGEQEAGYHEVKFDGTAHSSGVYYYRILSGDFVQTRRLLLLK